MSRSATPARRSTPAPRGKNKGKGDPALYKRMQESAARVRAAQARSSQTPAPAQPSRPPKPKAQCSNKECPQSAVVEDDGMQICMTCGFIVQESRITQELTFGETANGAAVVQGTFVGANEETARSSALAGSRLGGGLSSRQVTERIGKWTNLWS